MIAFFRHIRKQLLAKSKFSKYLIYAVGEIILVVIGILIALQINNWNESQKLIRNERIILTSLKTDFLANVEKIDSVLKEQKKQKLTVVQYLRYFNSDTKITLDSLTLKLWWTTAYRPFHSTDGTLSSLLNSSRIDLIKNNTLKEKLTAFPSDYNTYKEHEEEYEYYVKLLRQFAADHFSFSPYVEGLENQPISIPAKGENWIGNLRHQNDVAGLALQLQWYTLPALENIKTKNSEILNLLNESIDENTKANQ